MVLGSWYYTDFLLIPRKSWCNTDFNRKPFKESQYRHVRSIIACRSGEIGRRARFRGVGALPIRVRLPSSALFFIRKHVQTRTFQSQFSFIFLDETGTVIASSKTF